jgi:hypothetical protein
MATLWSRKGTVRMLGHQQIWFRWDYVPLKSEIMLMLPVIIGIFVGCIVIKLSENRVC